MNDKIFNAEKYFANNPAGLQNIEENAYELIPDDDNDIEDDDQTQLSDDTSSYHFGSVAPASQPDSLGLFDPEFAGVTPTQTQQVQGKESRFEDLKRDKLSWTNFKKADWEKCKFK